MEENFNRIAIYSNTEQLMISPIIVPLGHIGTPCNPMNPMMTQLCLTNCHKVASPSQVKSNRKLVATLVVRFNAIGSVERSSINRN